MDGAHERFSELYEAAYLPILNYARRRVDADVAADVAAEVFVIAWRRRADVPAGAPLPWLYGVARRVVANQRRGAARAVRLSERVAVSVRDLAGVADPADSAAATASIAAAFGRLSAEDREVLALVVWEGLGAREVAEVLSCSVAAVAARVSRARRRLRANLVQQVSEEY